MMQPNPYKQAGPIIEDIASTVSSPSTDSNPLYQFRQDQLFTLPAEHEEQFVMFDGYKVFLSAVWPFSSPAAPLDDLDWLLDMWDATQAPGVGVSLFVFHKQHKMMDSVPLYLSNPAFMNPHGDALKQVLKSTINGQGRNDIAYRYHRLLQTYPIMFETLHWVSSHQQNTIGAKLYRYGIPNAAAFIKSEDLTAELVHEAVKNARQHAAKRMVPPSSAQFVEMYRQLLELDGSDLVDLNELVDICLMNWSLGFKYIKAKSLPFNDALSVVMTFIYKRESDVSAYDNLEMISKLYDSYGPSDQWPTLDHVVKYVNAATNGRAQTKKVALEPSGSTLSGHGNATKTHVYE